MIFRMMPGSWLTADWSGLTSRPRSNRSHMSKPLPALPSFASEEPADVPEPLLACPGPPPGEISTGLPPELMISLEYTSAATSNAVEKKTSKTTKTSFLMSLMDNTRPGNPLCLHS